MMSIEPRNEPRMLRWFRRTYPSYNLQPLEEARRLARRYQGYGGTRFVEDDLAGDPEAGALASNGQGRPPSRTACAALQTARRRQRTS